MYVSVLIVQSHSRQICLKKAKTNCCNKNLSTISQYSGETKTKIAPIIVLGNGQTLWEGLWYEGPVVSNNKLAVTQNSLAPYQCFLWGRSRFELHSSYVSEEPVPLIRSVAACNVY